MSNEDQSHPWDVFVSHASEDKETFVRPLAKALQSLGVSVWYDEFSLTLGDSLSRSIDKGIAGSRYGLVIVSPAFIEKPWPEHELRGLVTREIDEGKVILPIWHGVNKRTVANFSPSLADKVAIRTADSAAEDIAIQVLAEVRPDLYEAHPRSELQKLVSGEAIQELQEDIGRLREQLSEYQCPYCGSMAVEQVPAPLDPEHKHWDMVEGFECGFETFGGMIRHPCPSDPKFPKLADYEFRYNEMPDEPTWKWSCDALPKTDMARCLRLGNAYGATKEEAHKRIVKKYEEYARRR